MIRRVRRWVVFFPSYLTGKDTMRTVSAECIFIHRGGWRIEGLNGNYPVKGKQKEGGGYGASLKEDHRFFYGAGVGMAGRGEALALESNLCEIDPNVVDKFGIPVLRFNVKYTENE